MWPGLSRPAIAYVASTLPLSLLDKKLEEWNISEVVLQGAAHHASYLYLQKRHPGVKIRVLAPGFFLNFLELAWLLLIVKVLRKRLFFFHECSCPVFDILTRVFRPLGHYYPQVTLASFVLVSPGEVALTKVQKLIALLQMESWFDYYRGDGDGNDGYFYVQAAKYYPATVVSHEIGESRAIIAAAQDQLPESPTEKKIIILCARDISDDASLSNVYVKVIDVAISMGFACYLKDHPAKHARLNLQHVKVIEIDPALPLELIDTNFALVVGVASTALLHFSERSISILKLLPGIDDDARDRRMAHLVAMPGALQIQFPEDFAELERILSSVA